MFGGVTGRFEVAEEIVRLLRRNDIAVEPVDSSSFSAEYFAERPPSERLINHKLDLSGLNIMRDWKICLQEYLDSYYQSYLPEKF